MIAGLLVGSFTNVLIARVPAGKGVITGRSACPRCNHTLAWYDNLPLLSWLVLRARCRYCSTRISAQYPLVEGAVALLWLAVYLVHGIGFTALLLAYLAPVSVALTVIDVRHHRLPHRIVLPSYAVTVAIMACAWTSGESASWWTALIGLVALGGFYGLLWFIYPKGMGFGDVTTAGLLGLALGFLGLENLAVGAIAGPLVGGLMVIALATVRKAGRGTRIPYGPALLTGAWIGLLAGSELAAGYLRILGVQ